MVTLLTPTLYFTKIDSSSDNSLSSKIARLLLAKAVEDIGIDYDDLEIEDNLYGKPYIKNYENLFFSISHSKEFVVCALASYEIGCDIEKIRGAKIAIADRFFTRDEACCVFDNNTFFRLWTLKESFVKAVGTGLKIPLNSFNICLNQTPITAKCDFTNKTYYFLEPNVYDGCRCSICSPKKLSDDDLKIIYIDYQILKNGG